MARERILGWGLLSAGVLLAAGAAGDIGQLMSLPVVFETLAGVLRDYHGTLRTAGYLVTGVAALIAGTCCFGS